MWLKNFKAVGLLGIALVARATAGQSDESFKISTAKKEAFIDSMISRMTLNDLVLQLHLMFADDIVGKDSLNELYDATMHLSPKSPVGVVHDWYPMNKSNFNDVQRLQMERSHIKIPLMLVEECLHGVGSFKQSILPHNLAMAASWDINIVYRVGRAIGTEARSIGVHGCFAPVLDLAQEPRWGRVQETFGEDKVLTAQMGVAYSSGLSKNSSWSEPDAVYPIMKHFAAHGAAQAGLNTAPFTGHGLRQVQEDLLIPFKAVSDLGGARGVMMAYNEIDGIPSAVNSFLYEKLEQWNFDGFTIADDTCVKNLIGQHRVADSIADALKQWFNAGGMIDFYDANLDTFLNTTKELVANGSVHLKTLQSHVRKILRVKYDLGLFQNPLIPENIDPTAIVDSHQGVALEAAHKSIVLLKNENQTLPLQPSGKKKMKIALIGPFADTFNFGDYSGTLGQQPARYGITIRQGILDNLKESGCSSGQLLSSWGANSWEYNNQYVIPPYLLSANGTAGGLRATYFSNTDFTGSRVSRIETPSLDWGVYPPEGLPSNNFSAIWEGQLEVPVDVDLDGWMGLAIGPNTTSKLFIDGKLISSTAFGPSGNVLGNIESFAWVRDNSTLPPAGGVQFNFRKGAKHSVRIEFQAWNNFKKTANVNSINSQLVFWWNLVSPGGEALAQAVSVARESDRVILAVGAAWNSDGENGDRATLGLSRSQDALVKAIFELRKPTILVLEGGRPFAIPEHYESASAVLSTYFGGQAGGQAIADVLFGKFNPGGRLPMTVPYHVGQLPVYYNYKPSAHAAEFRDIPADPIYPFGHGLSYTSFTTCSFSASRQGHDSHGSHGPASFGRGDWITFTVKVKNTGAIQGSYVVQIYLLGRVSIVTQPIKQLVAFERVYLDAAEERTVTLKVEVDRYLLILNRQNEWELEKTSYTFACLENGGSHADTNLNATMRAQ